MAHLPHMLPAAGVPEGHHAVVAAGGYHIAAATGIPAGRSGGRGGGGGAPYPAPGAPQLHCWLRGRGGGHTRRPGLPALLQAASGHDNQTIDIRARVKLMSSLMRTRSVRVKALRTDIID